MKTVEPRAIHLKDYSPPLYRIPDVSLDVRLDPGATRVTATMKVERATARGHDPLVLDGQRLKLISLKLDGVPLRPPAYSVDATSLTLHEPPECFTLEI